MLVCHCKGLSDREIDRAIRSGAATPCEVAQRCGAGSVCGGCRPVIHELIESRAAATAPRVAGYELAAAS